MKSNKLPEGPYKPDASEIEILNYWLENKFYKPETAEKILTAQRIAGIRKTPASKFTIINPPPNAYARPHIGNVSGYSYQDLFGRRARMLGNTTLLFPGKDHAAQQGEVVYIRDVLTPKGQKKDDYTRSEFIAEAHKYFSAVMKIARTDEQRIGLSADFDRDLFTLDNRVAPTIYNTFAKMWREKIVYKGVRVVNWSPGLNSAVADIDTERLTVKSKMYYLKYALPGTESDLINLKSSYFNKEITAEIKENIPTKLKTYFYLAKASEQKIYIWSSTELKTGEKISLKPNYAIVPLAGELPLLGSVAGDLSEQEYTYSFKYINQILGSAFIVKFSTEIEKSQLEYFYSRGFIIGTVRPETQSGDTAIAINPSDLRYVSWLEKDVPLLSLNGEITLRIIADPAIEKELGTGLLKVTPAHSTTDYQIYLNYNQAHLDNPLSYKNVVEKNSRLNSLAGLAARMHVEDERNKIAELYKAKGLIVFEEPTESNITLCERTKTIIQPLMSSQWFIDTDKLKSPAIKAIDSGAVKIHPDYMTKKLSLWLENLRDWPISRSIWWGYRLPVWYKGTLKEYTDINGQIAVEIGGKKMADMFEAISTGYMKLQLTDQFKPILIPGRGGDANHSLYKELKITYPWAEIVNIKNIADPNYSDYEAAFSKLEFNSNSVVVAHSLGSPAILDYIQENNIKINKLILLAPTTESSPNYNHYLVQGFWKNKEKYNKLINSGIKITIIHSDNDKFALNTIAPFEQLAGLIGAEMKFESNKMHFVGKEYSYGSSNLNSILNSANDDYNHESELVFQSMAKEGWIQDDDVFDTWFSSGQWPVAALAAEGLLDYYPTSILETGYDILELWVSRMIMLGMYTQGEVPFKDVYLHGLIKGEDGQKMSKSKGNLIYTEDIIKEFGADTLRLFYIVGNKAGASYRVNKNKITGYRNFLNKIWNVSKFILNNLADLSPTEFSELIQYYKEITTENWASKTTDSLANYKSYSKIDLQSKLDKVEIDYQMLLAVNELITDLNEHFINFRIGMSAEAVYQHLWQLFADIYIEQVKSRLFTKDKLGNPINTDTISQISRLKALSTLCYCLITYLKLLHPYIPFITELVWQHLPAELKESESIMYSVWPINF